MDIIEHGLLVQLEKPLGKKEIDVTGASSKVTDCFQSIFFSMSGEDLGT